MNVAVIKVKNYYIVDLGCGCGKQKDRRTCTLAIWYRKTVYSIH